MTFRSSRNRLGETTNIWPGFVDVLATLLIVIIFILMVFTVSQIYLSDAISGRDKALLELRLQISELSKIIKTEIVEKEEALESLSDVNSQLSIAKEDLNKQTLITDELQTDLSKKNTKLFIQDQNIMALSSQITELLGELRIVAKALEVYEGIENTVLNTEGLGDKINKALAVRIEQLKILNFKLDEVNKKLELSELSLSEKINELNTKNKNLMSINKSLGIEDGSIVDQLNAIKSKNQELAKLNQNLINKDSTIFDLRGKIIELNNILSITDKNQLKQESELKLLKNNINIIEDLKLKDNEISKTKIEKMELQASQTFEQISILADEIENLKDEITILNLALEASEKTTSSKNLEIKILGERLNKALTSKIFELQKYRSEFFGKLKSLLGERDDIKIVGDRFIFESELLFDSASANLQENGKEKLKEIALTLMETTIQIPTEIDWIILVEGHTDKRPIKTSQYPSNWELSSARANSVLKLLLEIGFSPERLAAAGYGEFYPISDGESKEDFQQNRRIELKLTSR